MSVTSGTVTRKNFFRFACYESRFAGPVLDSLLADPDLCFSDAEPERTLKHDRTTTLVKVSDADKYWVAKRYNTKNVWHAIRRCFARSRAWNCWQMAHALRAAGLHTAGPVAVLEHRLGPLRRRSFYFCEYLTGTPLEKIINPSASAETLTQMGKVFAEMFGKLAVARIAHGDLKFTNLLWNGNEIVLLDLDAVAIYPAERYARAYRKDRFRFLRNWDHMPEFRDQLAKLIPERPHPNMDPE